MPPPLVLDCMPILDEKLAPVDSVACYIKYIIGNGLIGSKKHSANQCFDSSAGANCSVQICCHIEYIVIDGCIVECISAPAPKTYLSTNRID